MTEQKDLMPKNVWTAIVLVASIVGATLYVQKNIQTTIKEVIEPFNDRLKDVEADIKKIERTQTIHEEKINNAQEYFRTYFLKPNEPEFKRK